MLLEWYSWLLRSLHIKKKSFSLSKRRDTHIEFAKGPRFDSAFEYTHTHTPSPFFFLYVRKALRETTFFFLHFSHFFPKVHKKMSEL